MIIDCPNKVDQAFKLLWTEGYYRAEAYPIAKWRAQGFPEVKSFYDIVDCFLKIERILQDQKSGKTLVWDSL